MNTDRVNKAFHLVRITTAVQNNALRYGSAKDFVSDHVKLDRYMKTHGLTQSDVAGMLDVSVRTVQRWLYGQTPIPYVTAVAIQALTGDRL